MPFSGAKKHSPPRASTQRRCLRRRLVRPEQRGLVSGLVVAGFGFGSFVFNFVQLSLVNPGDAKPTLTPYPQSAEAIQREFGHRPCWEACRSGSFLPRPLDVVFFRDVLSGSASPLLDSRKRYQRYAGRG